MISKRVKQVNPTDDAVIRSALKERLVAKHRDDIKLRIIDEFCVNHGSARVDIAVVNGVLHGYEIKSDRDTLVRLPEQIEAFNNAFEEMTIVVGKDHLYHTIKAVPDWWGLMIAKISETGEVVFSEMRTAQANPQRQNLSVAKLLWRDEALEILEEIGKDQGVRSKARRFIYTRLSEELSPRDLGDRVREAIFLRKDWRSDAQLA